MIKGLFNVVVGSQAGSEAKGKLSAHLSYKFRPRVIAVASSPNAGHTAYFEGQKYVSYHLPIAAVTNPDSHICLGPSSVIRLDILLREMATLQIDPARLHIHPRAVMIPDSYLEEERVAGLRKIGSTNQGTGAARAHKVMRDTGVVFASEVRELHRHMADTVDWINDEMEGGGAVLCEMTQGFDLDLEHGIDPRYCTSKMINPAMAMAEAGVAPSMIGHVYGVLRPYPIRVNNRDGSSGPYAEAKEITWEEIGRRCECPHQLHEITTTTKLPRRVFEFSYRRFDEFVQVCRPTHLCVQFVNYINWSDYGRTDYDLLSEETLQWVNSIGYRANVPVAYIGTSEEAIIDLKEDEGEGTHYFHSGEETDYLIP